MKKSDKSYFVLVVLSFLLMVPAFTWADGIGITVNASKSLGSVPDVLRSNIWIQNLDNIGGASYSIEKFLKDNRPAVVQLSVPIMQRTTSFEDYKKQLDKYFRSHAGASFIRKMKEYDTLVIIGFDPCPMPSWLSSNPGNTAAVSDWGGTVQACSPPKDYNAWTEVIRYSLNYIKSLGVNNLGIYTGHEQERDWIGKDDSFFRYYTMTANAAKSVDKSIKVGGPGPSWITARRSNCKEYKGDISSMCRKDKGWANPNGEPFVKNFISYVAANNAPIDFINWHAFNVSPYEFEKTTKLIDGWLSEAGLKKVVFYPSDWSYWSFPPYPDDLLDNQEIGAYIPSAIYHMLKAGIEWHGHDFDVRDYGGRENPVKTARNNSTFIGDWSLFTWGGTQGGGIIKPMYNSFKALNMVMSSDQNRSRQLVETSFPEENSIVAMSALSNNSKDISVLISNYIPGDTKRTLKYIFEKADAQIGFSADDKKYLMNCAKNKDIMKSALSECRDGLWKTKEDRTSRELKIQSLNSIVKNISYAGRNPKTVQVHLENIPFNGKAVLKTYTIDSMHSNSCSYNKKTATSRSGSPCGIGGNVDKAVWEIKQKAGKSALEDAEDYLMTLGYKQNVIDFLIKEGKSKCEGKKGVMECMAKIVQAASGKFGYPAGKAKTDMMDAYAKYRETSARIYYDSIDKINGWKDISLEGSERAQAVTVSSNQYNLTLNMEPNSVWVLVLSKE